MSERQGLAPGTWSTRMLDSSRSRTLFAIAILWIAITVLRFSVRDPAQGVTLMYALPVTLTAVRFGRRAGLVSAVLSMVLFVIWVLVDHVAVAPLGYAVRTLTFLILGGVLGEYAQRLRALIEAHGKLIESAPDAIVRADGQGRIVLANQQAEELFGYARGELLGKSVDVLVPERFLARHQSRRAGYGSNPRLRSFGVDQELFGLRSDGSEIPVEINLAPTQVGSEVLVTAVIRDVTRRKVIEEELKRTSRFFRVSRDLVCTAGMDGYLWELGDMWEEVLGWSKAELRSKPVLELVHPDDQERAIHEATELASGGVVSGYICRMKTKGGSWRWLEWSAMGIAEEGIVYGSARDVTDRKLAEAELALLGTVTETMAEGVALVQSSDHTIIYANRSLERMLGYEQGDLNGRPSAVLNAPGERTLGEARSVVEALEEDGSWSGEVRNLTAAGGAVWCRLAVSTFDHPQHGQVWVAVHSDITGEKETEQERERLLGELARSNRELEQFAYTASHDLSEPLRVISGFARLLDRRAGPDLNVDSRRYTDAIISGADRMQAMVDGLLEYARTGRAEVKRDPVDCERVVQDTVSALRPLIAETHGEVVAGKLPTVPGEAALLGRLFQNLITNGLKYANGDHPRVEVSGEQLNGEWLFAVRDNGTGIDPSQADTLFDMFRRGDVETPGAGMGLAICKQVVEKHGGRIWVDPGPEGGSVFRFTLPAAANGA
jgi:PAS domain S-box-containing protein